LIQTIRCATLIQARLKFSSGDFHLEDTNPETVNQSGAGSRRVTNLAGNCYPSNSEARNRLSFGALQLLQHVPTSRARIPLGDELEDEILELLPEAQYVSRLIGELPR